MKKLFVYLAGALMALSLAACAPKETGEIATGGPMPGAEMQMETAETEDPRLSKVSDPDAPVMDAAVVYSFNEDGVTLIADMIELEEMNENALVTLLIEAGILEEGTTVNSFEIEGGVKAGPGVDPAAVGDGDRIGTLDLSAMPDGADKIMLAAIANSFCENFELDKLVVLVDGAPYESEFITDGYLYFDNSVVKATK